MLRVSLPSLTRGWFVKISRASFSRNSISHYDVLGVLPTATSAEIKAAYLKLSKKYHPDVTHTDTGHDNFVRINEAYSVLSRPVSRREYDLRRSFSQAHHFRPESNRQWSADSGQAEGMYEEWYRTLKHRRVWSPQDDYASTPGPDMQSFRKGVYIISLLVALSLVFQILILNRSQKRHHQQLLDERRRWYEEIEPKLREMDKKKEKAAEEPKEK